MNFNTAMPPFKTIYCEKTKTWSGIIPSTVNKPQKSESIGKMLMDGFESCPDSPVQVGNNKCLIKIYV